MRLVTSFSVCCVCTPQRKADINVIDFERLSILDASGFSTMSCCTWRKPPCRSAFKPRRNCGKKALRITRLMHELDVAFAGSSKVWASHMLPETCLWDRSARARARLPKMRRLYGFYGLKGSWFQGVKSPQPQTLARQGVHELGPHFPASLRESCSTREAATKPKPKNPKPRGCAGLAVGRADSVPSQDRWLQDVEGYCLTLLAGQPTVKRLSLQQCFQGL